MVVNFSLNQSKYPVQKVIDGDTFVILTKKQADDINVIFESQKSKISLFKKEIKHKDSLLLTIHSDTIIDTRFTQRLDLLEHWLYFSAMNSTWIYYSYEDSSIYYVDLGQYFVRKDDLTGDLLFIRAEEPFPVDNKEQPKINWNTEIIEPKRPKVEKLKL